jgi:ATP-dependent DNA helicase RecG
MKEGDLEFLVRELVKLPSECAFCEFKVNWDDHAAIGRYISALSNGACIEDEPFGYIVWGIQNDTHAIVGTRFDFRSNARSRKRGNGEESNQQLYLWLAQHLSPSVPFEFLEAFM